MNEFNEICLKADELNRDEVICKSANKAVKDYNRSKLDGNPCSFEMDNLVINAKFEEEEFSEYEELQKKAKQQL